MSEKAGCRECGATTYHQKGCPLDVAIEPRHGDRSPVLDSERAADGSTTSAPGNDLADAAIERIRICAYLSFDTVYQDDFCVRCSHEPSNCECPIPVYMAGWQPDETLKALKLATCDELRDQISFTALLSVLTRLRSKNRNPERDWYLGWNAALDCLTNDIQARFTRNESPVAPPSPRVCQRGVDGSEKLD